MCLLNEILTFEYQSEYATEYDLQMKKDYTEPKLYTANGDLSKRWYIYFSYKNPKTGKLERQSPIYAKANRRKTKEDRLQILTTYRKVLLRLLREGFNPYLDNSIVYQKKQQKSNAQALNSDASTTIVGSSSAMTVVEAFDFTLTIKEKTVATTTYKSYRSRVNKFLEWLATNHPTVKTIDKVSKNIFMQFLNHVLQQTSARNRNNYRIEIGSLLQTMEDNDIIAQSFIKKIPVLKSTPERNKTYTSEKQEQIFDFLENKDPLLLLYIKFISYNFLRPIEVNRLRVGDLNLKDKMIRFKAKNSAFKTKIIPDILLKELPDLSNVNEDYFLFTPNAIGGLWVATESNRRDHFSKRFKKVVKEPFNLGKDYGLYSFRHTYITKLYRKLVIDSSPFEARSKLMQITGHNSMSALQKYLRDIDAELPEDYSYLLEVNN